MIRIEINEETFAIKMYMDDDEKPFLYQPHYPHGEPFSSYSEALFWAEIKREELENPNSPYLAGPNKETPRQLKVAEEQIRTPGIVIPYEVPPEE